MSQTTPSSQSATEGPAPGSPHRPFRKMRAVVLLVVIVGASLLFETVRAPWLRSYGLWPTLTGTWYGSVSVDGRPAGTAFLELDGYAAGRSATVSGRLRWCDATRQILGYRVTGTPRTWWGDRFWAELRSEVERTSGEGPGQFEAEWSGEAVRGRAPLVALGGVATVSEDTPTGRRPTMTLELVRGTEASFAQSCAP